MMQLDMFDAPYVPPHIAESKTSLDAAESIKDSVPSLQSLVLSAFRRAGFPGLTDSELFAEMSTGGKFKEATIRARRIELTKTKWAEKCGFPYPPLVDSGGKRKFGNARTDSTVWCLREFVNGERR